MRKGLLILSGIQQHHTGQERFVHMEPSLGHTSASSPCIHLAWSCFFLSPVSWTPGCLVQQQRGRASRARWRGLSVEHEVQEGDTGVRLPLSGTESPYCPFSLFAHVSTINPVASFEASMENRQPNSPCLLTLSITPLILLPSLTFWVHHAGIHLHHIHPQTHVREAPEKTCGAGVEWNLSTAAGLSVWGRAGYHVHPNKGPVFRPAAQLLCSAQSYYNACPEAPSPRQVE